MNQILLLSTPLNDGISGISLIEEPKSLQRIKEREEKVQAILGYDDQFWRSVGGIIWNPTTRNGVYYDRKGFMIELPKMSARNQSFLNARNFPNEWTIEQRREYIDNQITAILDYTVVNDLWLPVEKDWERFWNRNGY